jgi:hypothetical protein
MPFFASSQNEFCSYDFQDLCTFHHVWLKDSIELTDVLRVVQEKPGTREAVQIRTEAKETSAISENIHFKVWLKGNVSQGTESYGSIWGRMLMGCVTLGLYLSFLFMKSDT